MQELGQIVTNNIGAVITTAIFIWYLSGRDKAATKRDDTFNTVINTFSEKLQGLSDALHSLEAKVDGKRK